VVWDTLARPRDMEGVAELTRDLPVTVVYSHGDWDHVWGTGGLEQPWEEILAHRACADRFRRELPDTLKEKVAEDPEAFGDVQLVAPSRTFRNDLTLDLGGITLEIHSLPGHTPDSVVGFVPEWRVMLAGDAVETPLPFLNSGSSLGPWVEGLEAWIDRLEKVAEPSFVIPSHGRIGGPDLLRDNVRYLAALRGGREPVVPQDLSRFYRETHADNLTLARTPRGLSTHK